MSAVSHDAIVIGGGPGGYSAAIRLAQLGKRVLCVEKERLGGVCLNWGCMPSKALLHVGEVISAARDVKAMGVEFGPPKIDLNVLNSWKAKMIDDLVGGIGTLFKANKVEWVAGVASIVDDRTVSVKSAEAGAQERSAENLVIATGSEPIPLPGFERNGKTILNSDDSVSLAELPKSILILGAGVIGLEFATIYRRLGAEVTVVELADRALGDTDQEISTLLLRILKKQGIDVNLKTKAASAQVKAGKVTVVLEGEINGSREYEKVLVAVGRRPRTAGLGLEKLGLKTDRGFIGVDEQRRTNKKGVYAIGDCAGPPLLAHKAMKEGVVAAEAIAGMASAYDPMAVPNCVYTDPQVATAGLSEEAAKASGYDVSIGKFRLNALGRARTVGISDGMVKIVGDKKTDLVLGVHVVSPTAESMIGEAVIAIEMGATVEDLGLSIHPHPTFAEPIMEAAEAMHGRAIHIVNAPVHAKT
ncbi:MAG: dihydrolipoyl dehydrogenase [Candidatus Eremiobacteraeota bacterium]|nr:dihydrolipoyl dehydrogenase [Candidatus Eremiobacteraeota bacterium]MBC5827189.1 dihydrolipoyl dehydrogenase [Candidatus Eremiobacteraeota bacterium]